MLLSSLPENDKRTDVAIFGASSVRLQTSMSSSWLAITLSFEIVWPGKYTKSERSKLWHNTDPIYGKSLMIVNFIMC